MSDALHDALQANRARMADAHPKNLDKALWAEAPAAPQHTNSHWVDFSDRDARSWSRLQFLLPRRGRSATVMGAAMSSWRQGGLPHLPHSADLARAARAMGHTPESAWELLVTLRTLQQESPHDPEVLFDLRVWALWLEHQGHQDDPITAGRRCLEAVGQR